MEVIKFIFSSFWIFSGVIILIWSIGMILTCIVAAIFGGTVNIGGRRDDDEESEDENG